MLKFSQLFLKVTLILPTGDLIFFKGYDRTPVEVLPAKKNPCDNILQQLFILEDG